MVIIHQSQLVRINVKIHLDQTKECPKNVGEWVTKMSSIISAKSVVLNEPASLPDES